MEQMILFSWSGVLSALVGVAGFVAWEKNNKLNMLEKMLNDTKLEVTRDNVTKAEIEKLERYIDERFNKFEEKIDRWHKSQDAMNKLSDLDEELGLH